MTNRQKLESITKFCDELGIGNDYKIAQTRTIYMTISHNRICGELIIRLADHGDVRATADYSVDEIYGTVADCKKWILEKIKFANKALNRLRKNKRRKKRIEKENNLMPMVDVMDDLLLCKNGFNAFFVCEDIKSKYSPDTKVYTPARLNIVRTPTKKDIEQANKNGFKC